MDLFFRVPTAFSGVEAEKVWVYLDTKARGPKQSVPGVTPAAGSGRLANGDVERGTDFWQWSDAEPVTGDAHSGDIAARLRLVKPEGYSLIANSSPLVLPETTYKLTFWARSNVPDLKLMANFYALGGEYDFPQMVIPMTGDGVWHPYEISLTTGDFSPGVRPALRIWLLGQVGDVLVDDVALQLVGTQGESARAVARALKVESR